MTRRSRPPYFDCVVPPWATLMLVVPPLEWCPRCGAPTAAIQDRRSVPTNEVYLGCWATDECGWCLMVLAPSLTAEAAEMESLIGAAMERAAADPAHTGYPMTQDALGRWVPSVPLPMMVRRHRWWPFGKAYPACLRCEVIFDTIEEYERDWLVTHGPDGPYPDYGVGYPSGGPP